MGIDIDYIIERFCKETGEWKVVQYSTGSKTFIVVDVTQIEQIPGEDDEKFEERIELWLESFPIGSLRRNYKLFSLLADMCNEFDIIPVSPIKGTPLDISYSAKVVCDNSTGFNNNSITWLYYSELLDIYKYDMVRPNSVLHSDYTSGKLDEFDELMGELDQMCKMSQFGEIEKIDATNIRLIMWFA